MKSVVLLLVAASILLFGCVNAQTQAGAEVSAQASGSGPTASASGQAGADVGASVQAGAQGEGDSMASATAMASESAQAQSSAQASASIQAQSGGNAAFAACIQGARQWKVDYSVTSTGGASSSTMMTQYFKGENKMRNDVTAEGINVRTYMLGEFYSCFEYSGSWTCNKITVPQQNTEADVKQNVAKYEADGTISVAGTTADCYKATVDSGQVRYCISRDCVPLYVKTSGTASGVAFETETTATAYTTSVSDADFVLPAEASSGGYGAYGAYGG